MKILRPLAIGLALSFACTVSALAQDSRPGGNTIVGDTGIWFVPTGETLPKGKWSGGVQLVNFDRSEGFSDITDIGGMFAFGASDRIEIFGSFGMRRIDSDMVPVAQRGQPQDYLINQGWSTGLGDAWLGAKFNITSQTSSNGYATALRVMAKLPTASRDDDLGTGKFDFRFDLMARAWSTQRRSSSPPRWLQVRASRRLQLDERVSVWGIGRIPELSEARASLGEMKRASAFEQAQTFTGTTPAPGMPRNGSGCDAICLAGSMQRDERVSTSARPGVTYRVDFLHRHDFRDF